MLNGNLKPGFINQTSNLILFTTEDLINISNFFFRDKRLSLNSEGEYKIKAFFKANL